MIGARKIQPPVYKQANCHRATTRSISPGFSSQIADVIFLVHKGFLGGVPIGR
jgi:hypothetical protein